MPSGDVKTCTITNNDPLLTGHSTGTLIVKNDVQNFYDGNKSASDFSISISGTSPSPSSFFGNASGTIVTLNPGSCTVQEVLHFGYTNAYVGDCSGNIVAGETKTCKIINADVAPQLNVIVNVIGGTKVPTDFTVGVNASKVTTPSFAGNASGTIMVFVGGLYSADEENSFGYIKTLSLSCSGTALAGEVITCEITNTWVGENEEVVVNNFNSSSGGGATGGSNNSSGGSGIVASANSISPVLVTLNTPANNEQVLGASTQVLPRTGTPIWFTLSVLGFVIFALNKKLKFI